jgi:hypothetical protein
MISRSPAPLSTESIHEKMTISQRLWKHRERQMFWLALSSEMIANVERPGAARGDPACDGRIEEEREDHAR